MAVEKELVNKYFFKKSSGFNPCFCRALNSIGSVSKWSIKL